MSLLIFVFFTAFSVLYAKDNSLTENERVNGWQLLFNGKDFSGWKASENKGSFKIENGAIRVNGNRSHLFYVGKVNNAKFKDFIYRVKVMTKNNSNSGLYFHTRYQETGWPKVGYEAQVNNTHKDWRKTASIYAVDDVKKVVVKDDEWFDYEIEVRGKRIITRINGQTMVDYTEPEVVNIKGWPDKKLSEGTFAIQAHDPISVVYVKNIRVLPLHSSAEAKVKMKSRTNKQWYNQTDYGPFLASIVDLPTGQVRKGLVVRLGEYESHSLLFDTETMQFTGAWDGFIKLHGTPWNGSHGGNPKMLADNLVFVNKPGPGWAKNGSFADPRVHQDGPLPKEWAKYKGVYRNGREVVLKYTVGKSTILDKPAIEKIGDATVITRSILIDRVHEDMSMVVTDGSKLGKNLDVFLQTSNAGASIKSEGKGRRVLKIANGVSDLQLKLFYVLGPQNDKIAQLKKQNPVLEINRHLKGGPSLWNSEVTMKGNVSKGGKGKMYVVDNIPVPSSNPYHSKFRSGGFDFFSNGTSAAFCTWNGDVWVCKNIQGDLQNLKWKRYAAGLFETLGLKIVDDVVYVTGKDQITRLHDLNKDGEADYYECFNNDVHITANFHEFTFDLQTDKEGNFYFTKGNPVLGGGRGFDRVAKHNGTVLKVSKDGSKLEIYSKGLRAPGGVGVGPNGEVTTGENEGTYIPHCKLNWCTPGSFHGVVPSEWKGRNFVKTLPGAPKTFDQPLCWFPMEVDNSGGSQIWTPHAKWGLPKDTLLHCSYGKSSLYRVMYEKVDGQIQGGVFRLPFNIQSSAMRARFNSVDGQLYMLGFKGWQTNAAKECAFQRVRYTGEKVAMPSGLNIKPKGIQIHFTHKLDKELAEDPASYNISMWNYLWGPMYGSGEFSALNPNKEVMAKGLRQETKRHKKHDKIKVKSAKLADDGMSVFLEIAEIMPVHQMKIGLDLESVDGQEITNTIYNTINKVGKQSISWFGQ